MPTPAQEFAALYRLTPADAMAYLRRRNKVMPTYSWQDLWQDEHAQQFTVSRLARADLLAALQDQITKSVGGDMSRRDFMRDAQAMLREAGWWGEKELVDPGTGDIVKTRFDPARLKLIFDTNTRMAYAAGQWERIERTKRTHPYIRYITQADDKVRPAHRAWHNVTLPVDDAFWSTHFPPNGWRCRCRVVAVSRRDYQAGITPTGERMVKKAPDVVMREWVNRRTGVIESVPVGVDPGFNYNPGKARKRAQQQAVQDKLAGLEPGVGAALWQELRPALGAAQMAAWQSMVDTTVATKRAGGLTVLAHAVEPDTVKALADLGVTLDSAAVLMRDSELLHALRDSKSEKGSSIPDDVWRELPKLLQGATPYLDQEDQALIYAFDLDGKAGKVVVRVNYSDKGRFGTKRARVTANFIQTGGVVEGFNLAEGRYRKLGE